MIEPKESFKKLFKNIYTHNVGGAPYSGGGSVKFGNSFEVTAERTIRTGFPFVCAEGTIITFP